MNPTGAAPRPDDDRQTAADEVFDSLHRDIRSLRLTPGTRLSEADVARRLAVSRQPVREAFIRLGDMNLLHIRPQRATVVRRIAEADMQQARFVRTAVEIEVAQRACTAFTPGHEAEFRRNLARQARAVADDDPDGFHALDYEFHQLLCDTAGCPFVSRTIAATKLHVDRVCMISLNDRGAMATLLQDHEGIVACLGCGDREGIVALVRLHLSRLDHVIATARQKHPEYFED